MCGQFAAFWAVKQSIMGAAELLIDRGIWPRYSEAFVAGLGPDIDNAD